MASDDIYIDEFLYRGRPPGHEMPGGWHVVLGRVVPAFGDGAAAAPLLSGLMSAAQAEAAGWPLSRVLGEVNAEALSQAEQQRIAAEAGAESVRLLRNTVEALTGERDGLSGQVGTLTRRLDEEAAANADLRATIATLRASLRDAGVPAAQGAAG